MNKKVLVTGSKGYIGYQTYIQLQEAGYEVYGVDWSNDVRPGLTVSFDSDAVRSLIERQQIKTVIHFAADHEVGRSVEEPSVFYNNNVVSTIRFLDKCISRGVENFIFSSSSSVYGDLVGFPTSEKWDRKNPMSPYGRTKDMIEEVLKDYEKAYGIRTLSLRYFNAAGADPLMRNGYTQEPQSHLIPILARCFSKGTPFTLFGDDYDTPDGTCIRDYTHVWDIANAHILAIDYLRENDTKQVFNIGQGKGESIIDVIDTFREYTGKDIEINYASRRAGDSAQTHAGISSAKECLNWAPVYKLFDIVEHAYKWENR